MVILHYAGISNNKASGVSVVVPQIVNSMGQIENVALYNYSRESVNINAPAVQFTSKDYKDDYHAFPEPFSHPDIVVFHSPFGLPRMKRVCRSLKKDGIPYVVVPHGCFSKPAMKKKWLKKYLALYFFFHDAFVNASAIQYLCENERNMSVLKHRSIIVPNGITVRPVKERDYTEIKNIIFIGRKDIYTKGIDILLMGCAKKKSLLLKNRVKVSLYGPGNDVQNRKINEWISDNELEGIVENKPGIFGVEKEEVLARTDLFVLTSRSEGQPIAVLEALAHAIPVLVTHGTGFGEEVQEHCCGIAVDESAEQIAEGIEYAIYYPEQMKSMSQNAYAFVSETYSWNHVTDLGLKRYKELCDEKDCGL